MIYHDGICEYIYPSLIFTPTPRKESFMQFNKYSLYSLNVGISSVDEVDECIHSLQRITQYDDVVKFITNKFGDIDERKLLDFKKLNKQIEIKFKPDAVEFHAASKWKQYFGKGWRKPEPAEV